MVKEYLIPTLRSTDLIPIGNGDRSLTWIKKSNQQTKTSANNQKKYQRGKEEYLL